MPKKTYYLEADKKNPIQFSWGLNWKNFSIIHKEKEVGKFENVQELKEGKTFVLEDESNLYVQLSKTLLSQELIIRHNGKILPGTPADPSVKIKNIFILLLIIGGLNILIGVMAEMTRSEMMLSLGAGIGTIIIGGLFLILAFLIKQKHSLVALIVVIALMAIDIVLTIIVASEIGKIPTYGIILKVLFLIIFINGISAIRKMKADKQLEEPL